VSSDNYDQSHNERPRNALGELLARPFKRSVDVLRNRLDRLNRLASTPAFLDQFPSNAKPYRFSKLYGPLPLTTAQRWSAADDGVGFVSLAAAANNAAYVTPRNGNIKVNREGSWYWTTTSVTGFYSLTYDSDPGFGATTFVNPLQVRDIFSPAIESNGGAIQVNYFMGHVNYGPRANICFDLKLYDTKRGRFLHDDALPMQTLSAQNFANKYVSAPSRFDPNTEIEPRVRIQEIRPGSLLDTDAAFNAAQFAAYLCITFGGYKVLDV